ncbi:formate dehydrogenase subunit delta [Massilia sp. TS11]|uniref:formate dehydrogenase subunit delta n=1 Tax=Massilia sp. TS11 TaxID=2908003 RepID=UPI001EDC8AA1|nr:formate dehydrogenase subunit delta [Massilia sp. TS11]MCG2584946.1 formate dehydrogenase subunit delta [Massilia sp. TS11]
MDIENLVGMANRIGDFFESMPDAAEAKAGIANHIAKFWEPRMREALVARLAGPETATLHPMVRAAVLENLPMMARKRA